MTNEMFQSTKQELQGPPLPSEPDSAKSSPKKINKLIFIKNNNIIIIIEYRIGYRISGYPISDIGYPDIRISDIGYSYPYPISDIRISGYADRRSESSAERSEAVPPSEARLHRAKRGSTEAPPSEAARPREGHREVAITSK